MTSTLGGHDRSRRVKESPGARMETDGQGANRQRQRETNRQGELRGTQDSAWDTETQAFRGPRARRGQKGAGSGGEGKTGMGGDLRGRAAGGGGPRPLPTTEACSSRGTRPRASKGRWRLQGEHRWGGRCSGCHTPLSEKAGHSCTRRSRANLHLGDAPWWAERAKEDAVPLRSG